MLDLSYSRVYPSIAEVMRILASRHQACSCSNLPQKLENDQTVTIEAKDGRIIITPIKKKQEYALDELLSLSPAIFNKKILLALVAPVTSRVRGHGFEVMLTGEKSSGVVLCHQVQTIDFMERDLKFVEKAPAPVVSETLAKVRTILTE